MQDPPQNVEYILICKVFLRPFGLYYFKHDTRLRRLVTNSWAVFITLLFLVTALQALYQLLTREGFDLIRDCPGILTLCKLTGLQLKFVTPDFQL